MISKTGGLVALAVVIAVLGSTATAASRPTAQRVMFSAYAGVDTFVLSPLANGPIGTDRGSVSWCCWSERSMRRDGQSIEVNEPLAVLTGKKGNIEIRSRIEWVDAGTDYVVGTSTWKVVRGTGQYAGVTGHGRGAGLWRGDNPLSFHWEGYLTKRSTK
jgi:hypothetical protein